MTLQPQPEESAEPAYPNFGNAKGSGCHRYKTLVALAVLLTLGGSAVLANEMNEMRKDAIRLRDIDYSMVDGGIMIVPTLPPPQR